MDSWRSHFFFKKLISNFQSHSFTKHHWHLFIFVDTKLPMEIQTITPVFVLGIIYILIIIVILLVEGKFRPSPWGDTYESSNTVTPLSALDSPD